RGRRLRVSVVSSRDVSPPRSRWRTSPSALRRRRSEYWVVRRPSPRISSSYSRLTARVAWRRALHRQGTAAGLCCWLILDVYTVDRPLSKAQESSSGGRRTNPAPKRTGTCASADTSRQLKVHSGRSPALGRNAPDRVRAQHEQVSKPQRRGRSRGDD